MATNTALDTSLQKAVYSGKFFDLNDAAALFLIRDAFLPELNSLKNAPTASEPGTVVFQAQNRSTEKSLSPSRLLFGAEYDEVNRTLVGMLALKWIITNDYNTFTSSQRPSDKLRPESFAKLRILFSEGLKTPADVFALLVATVINDLGKDPNLAEDVAKITGRSCQGFNHDIVVYEAAEANMVPCLGLLDTLHKKEIILGLQFGSKLNIAQVAQAENVPGSLVSLDVMKGHEHAFDLKFMEQLLDIAGAAGHVDAWSAKLMTESVFQALITTRGALLDVIVSGISLRSAYDKILLHRALLLQMKGFRHLSVGIPQERALLRLLTMGRTTDKVQAEWFADAFHSLPEPIRKNLLEGLNVDGFNDGKAIVPYYMPAIISEGLNNTISEAPSAKKRTLVCIMTFLARVLEGTKVELGQQGVVIECNVQFAKDLIRSEAFKKDPRILDKLLIPMEGS